MVKVSVKWGKESYEVDATDSLDEFQALLFSLTMVPPARQKLMCKGKFIKDSAAVAALKDADKIVLMGTADELPKEPAKKIVFEEDLTDAQRIGVVKDILSAGLQNLGNTCYMASTLQCMRAVPELKQALIAKSNAAQPEHHDPNAAVVRQLGSLYRQMDQTTTAVTPMMFTSVFRSTFPQFAETDGQGHWAQQDAEEAMIQLMNCMANVLKTQNISPASSSSEKNTIDEYFGGEMETVTKLKGADDAAAAASSSSSSSSSSGLSNPETKIEPYRRLRCFIDIETNFLFQGIKAGLREELELRGQLFDRTSTLLTLPRYLIVQMMRFGWRNDTKKKSKILRKVDFPIKLDVMDFAHPKLKHQLLAARNFIKEEQDAKLGLTSLNKKAKTDAGQTAGSSAAPAASPTPAAAAAGASTAMEVDATAAAPAAAAPAPSTLTLTTPTTGNYEVFAVVTHKGRTSDSGHYVSWTKQKDDQWLKFDDDVVTRVTEDEVKRLHGGGDHDMAYLLFYRRVDDAVKFKGLPIAEPSAAAAPVFDNAKKQAAAAASSTPAAGSK